MIRIEDDRETVLTIKPSTITSVELSHIPPLIGWPSYWRVFVQDGTDYPVNLYFKSKEDAVAAVDQLNGIVE